MQIKSLLASAATVAFLSGGLLSSQAIAEKTRFDEGMSNHGKRSISVNTRPATDRHKDARRCLDGKNNESIIKCAHKYR